MKLAEKILRQLEGVSDRELDIAAKQFNKWKPSKQGEMVRSAMDKHNLDADDFDLGGVKLGKEELDFYSFPDRAAEALADTILD